MVGLTYLAELAAFRPVTIREQMLDRVSQPDYADWLHHVRGAAGCSHPIRLSGNIDHVTVAPGRRLVGVHGGH